MPKPSKQELKDIRSMQKAPDTGKKRPPSRKKKKRRDEEEAEAWAQREAIRARQREMKAKAEATRQVVEAVPEKPISKPYAPPEEEKAHKVMEAEFTAEAETQKVEQVLVEKKPAPPPDIREPSQPFIDAKDLPEKQVAEEAVKRVRGIRAVDKVEEGVVDKALKAEERFFAEPTQAMREKAFTLREESGQALAEGKPVKGLGQYMASAGLRAGAAAIEAATLPIRPIAITETVKGVATLITKPDVRKQVIAQTVVEAKRDPFGMVAAIGGGVVGGYVAGKLIGAGVKKVRGGRIELRRVGEATAEVDYLEHRITLEARGKKMPSGAVFPEELVEMGVGDELAVTMGDDAASMGKLKVPQSEIDRALQGEGFWTKAKRFLKGEKEGTVVEGVPEYEEIRIGGQEVKITAKEFSREYAVETGTQRIHVLPEGVMVETPAQEVTIGGEWYREGTVRGLEKGAYEFDVKGAYTQAKPDIPDLPEFKPIEPALGPKTPLSKTFGPHTQAELEMIKKLTQGTKPVAKIVTSRPPTVETSILGAVIATKPSPVEYAEALTPTPIDTSYETYEKGKISKAAVYVEYKPPVAREREPIIDITTPPTEKPALKPKPLIDTFTEPKVEPVIKPSIREKREPSILPSVKPILKVFTEPDTRTKVGIVPTETPGELLEPVEPIIQDPILEPVVKPIQDIVTKIKPVIDVKPKPDIKPVIDIKPKVGPDIITLPIVGPAVKPKITTRMEPMLKQEPLLKQQPIVQVKPTVTQKPLLRTAPMLGFPAAALIQPKPLIMPWIPTRKKRKYLLGKGPWAGWTKKLIPIKDPGDVIRDLLGEKPRKKKRKTKKKSKKKRRKRR